MKLTAADQLLLSTQTDCPMKIFISYAHTQSEIVTRIRQGLEQRGHKVWFDKKDIKRGDDWRETIAKGIRDSNGVLSFLSGDAVRQGGVCLDELRIAVGEKHGILSTVLLEKEDVVRPPAQLTHRQWLDMSDWRERSQGDPADYEAWFGVHLADIIRVVESQESREFVGLIGTIREKLRLGDISVSRQNWYLTQEYVGREWLTEKVESWLDDPNGGRLCALYGGPGTGKSAFAAQYAYLSGRAAASVFFEHGNEHFNTAGALIREVAFQLACRLPVYRDRLYGVVTTDERINQYNDQELFERLLTVPLSSYTIDGQHETLCIVLDGLDECTASETNTAAQLVGKFAQHFPKWLRILVLSRREGAVTSWLTPDREMDMLDDADANLADIRAYFAKRLATQLAAREDKDLLLDEMTARTEGVFLYAYVVTSMMLDGKMDVADVDAYPRGVSSAFMAWFSRYFPDREAYARQFRVYLGMIAVSPVPLPVEELDAVDVRYNPDDDCYELAEARPSARRASRADRLERLNALLQYRTNAYGKRTVSFSHKYIAEWLTQTDAHGQHPAGPYYAAPPDAMWAMEAAWCARLAAGKHLTEYEALHLLTYLQQVEDADTVVQWAKNETWAGDLEEYCEREKKAANYEQALELARADAERCKAIWEKTRSREAFCVYGSRVIEMGTMLSNMDKCEEARILLMSIAEACERELGTEHPITLTAQNDLAVYYRYRGYRKEALTLHLEVLKVREQVLGAEHPDTLTTKSNLASTYNAMGRHFEALMLNQTVLETRERTLGTKHIDTLTSMNNLAFTYIDMGHYGAALVLQEDVLEASEQAFGTEALFTLLAKSNLASIYSFLGCHEKALELALAVVEGRERKLGAKHSNTLTAKSKLASAYNALGRHEEALVLQLTMVAGREQIFGAEHPSTLTAKNNLAVTYNALGRHEEALLLELTVVEARERMFGEMHSSTLTAKKNLASTYSDLGRHEEELALRLAVVNAYERKRGVEDPKTLTAKNSLAITYNKLGRYEEALVLLLAVVEDREGKLGAKHLKTLRAKYTLASTYNHLGRYTESIPLLESVLSITLKRYGPEHSLAKQAREELDRANHNNK